MLLRRKYLTLRSEVERFHGLVRALHQAALADDEAGKTKVREQMLEAVDQMVHAAGREGPPQR